MKVEETMGPLGHWEELGLYFEVLKDLKNEIKCCLICLRKQKINTRWFRRTTDRNSHRKNLWGWSRANSGWLQRVETRKGKISRSPVHSLLL